MTNVPGIFAAGNVVHVYDLVDWVTEAGYVAGKGAAAFAQADKPAAGEQIPLKAGDNIRYVVPHKLDKTHLAEELVRLQMRAIAPIEERVLVTVEDQDGEVVAKKGSSLRPSRGDSDPGDQTPGIRRCSQGGFAYR
jgi:hypothetical protein